MFTFRSTISKVFNRQNIGLWNLVMRSHSYSKCGITNISAGNRIVLPSSNSKRNLFAVSTAVLNTDLRSISNNLSNSIFGAIRKPHLLGLPSFMPVRNITLLTSFNCVDNSELGQRSRRYRKPYLIGFYRKRKTADIGDIIRVAVRGRPCKALVVGTRKPKQPNLPRYDNNNIILLDDNLNPIGTRIRGPLPLSLRRYKDKYAKVLALTTQFV